MPSMEEIEMEKRRKALDKDASKRFSDAAALLDELDSIDARALEEYMASFDGPIEFEELLEEAYIETSNDKAVSASRRGPSESISRKNFRSWGVDQRVTAVSITVRSAPSAPIASMSEPKSSPARCVAWPGPR